LPWDEIKGTLFNRTPLINDRVIASLNKSYNDRLKSDTNLNEFALEAAEFRKSLKETRISLNESVRRKEMEAAEKRSAANNTMDTQLTGPENTPISNLSELEDEYLREGLLVLYDLIISKIG
jgi:carboxyl-terminal processing protease